MDAAQRQAKEQPAEFERKYEELVKEVEEQRKNTGHTMAGLRTKLRAAEEAAFAAREAAKGEIYEALSESEAQHSKRTQKMEELAQKRRQRELKAAQQRHDAAMEELKTKHTAELESLTAQLRTALIERDAASGDEQRHLSARHAEEVCHVAALESSFSSISLLSPHLVSPCIWTAAASYVSHPAWQIRALKKDFKAEIAMAREHWARKHEEEAAALAEKHANDLRQVQEASYQRELSVQHMYATELAAERESFASKLSEQHTLMLGSSQTSVAHERAIWEGRLAEAERQAHQAASAAEAAMSQEREKLKDLAAKHHLAIQALKKHHKAELGRVQSSMQERHNADLSKSHHSFQSELSNLSFNVQV